MSTTDNAVGSANDAVDLAKGSAASSEPDPRRWLALGIIAIAQLMVVLDASIVNIALPSIEKAKPVGLGVDQADGQWVITAYTLAFGGLLLLGGRVADYVGRKRMFLIGLIGFAAASALGGAAVSGPMLFGARALQGAMAAILAPSALSLITVTFSEAKERARAFGVYGAISGGGAAIGLLLGGVLTEYASWRWCLFVNVPIAIAAAVAAVGIVKESKAAGNTKYDIPGAVLVTGGLVALVYGFTEAAPKNGDTSANWTSPLTIALLAAAVVLLVGFVVWESRSAHPLLPLSIVTDRNRGAAYLSSLLIGAGLFSMFLFLTYYFQQTLGYSALKSGFAFLPFSGGIIVTAGVVSQLLPRTGPKPLMVLGAALGTAGMFYLITIDETTSYVGHVLVSELLLSVGMALLFVPLASLALVGIGGHDAGVASAMLNTAQQIGGALGTALLSSIFVISLSAFVKGHLPAGLDPTSGQGQAQLGQVQLDAAIHGYHVAFIVGGCLLAAALIVISVFVKAGKEEVANIDNTEAAMAG